MRRSSCHKQYVVYDALSQFFRYYLTERNIEKTLSMVTDDVHSLGTGKQEIALNKMELLHLMSEEISLMPDPFRYQLHNYHEKKITDSVYKCFCELSVWIEQKTEPKKVLHTRLTAGFIKHENTYLAYEFHLSEPSSTQREGEFFPLLYGTKINKPISTNSQRELVQLISELIPGGIMGGYVEPGFPLYVINEKMLDMLGYSYDEFIEATDELMENTIHHHDRQMVFSMVKTAFEIGDEYKLEYRLKRKDGNYIWVFDVGRKVITDENRVAIISIIVDISDSKAIASFFMEEAMKDSLTKLANRRALDGFLKGFFEKNNSYSLLMIDIDYFKRVNDIYGHTTGDCVLRRFADILRSHFREKDLLVRLGGDEFVVLIPGSISADKLTEKIQSIANKYKAIVSDLCPDSGSSLTVAAIQSCRQSSFVELYDIADKVLYDIKLNGKNSWRVFEW